jgi:hypothetical protein
VLEALGVSGADEELYRVLLRHPRCTTADLARRSGHDAGTVRRGVHRLEQLGLLTRLPGRPPRLRPARPDTAVDVLVARRQQELNQAQLAARELLAEMVVEPERRPDRLVEVVAGQQAVASRFVQLLAGTEGELLVLDRPPYVANPNRDGFAVDSVLDRAVRVRGIYATESLELPGALAEARRAAANGEQGRVHPDVPMKLVIADRRLALLPLAAGDVAGSALLVHPCALLDALCALFELLWQHAVPIFGEAAPTPADPLSTDALLAALAAGLKDDAIARQAGTSTRTVRRRITDLSTVLRARTRFQTGMLAERRGLLRPNPDENPT